MQGDAEVLRVEDLGYAYIPPQFAVRHLSFRVGRGEVLGLLGRNGAGKTTTVRMLTTLLPPTEGTAWILGDDVRKGGRALRARLGVVLQAESLDFVSVEKNLTLYAFLWGVERGTAKARAEEMLELFELRHVRRRKPWALSGGERRRFQVARELMHDMDILFLDEPTVGLDAVARRRILGYLRERARKGLTILFTTHILHEADMLCDRVAIMHGGKLLALDTAEGLKRRYGGSREVSVSFRAPLSAAVRQGLLSEIAAMGARRIPTSELPEDGEERFDFASDRVEEDLARLVVWAKEKGAILARMNIREVTLEGAFLGMVAPPKESDGVSSAPGPSDGEAARA